MANFFQKIVEMWNTQSTPDDEYEYDDRDQSEKDPYSSDDYYSDDTSNYSYPTYSAPKYEPKKYEAPKYTPSSPSSSGSYPWESGTSESSEEILKNLEKRIAAEKGSTASSTGSTSSAGSASYTTTTANTAANTKANIKDKEESMEKESSRLEVVVFAPDRFSDETRKIADELVKEEHTVVLSLENCDKDNSRRIIDFMSGAAYATGGKIKRAAASTFVVIPHSVKLTGDELLAQLEESGVL